MAKAAGYMLEVLGSPLCFGLGHEQALQWLQRLRDDDFPALASDPLWQSRHELTLKTGVKTNDGFLIYECAIEEYLAQGQGIKAVRLRVLFGERMFSETTSFWERYNYSMERHRELLRDNCRRANLTERLKCLNADN